jgi:hypothetical protein
MRIVYEARRVMVIVLLCRRSSGFEDLVFGLRALQQQSEPLVV